MRAAKEHSAYAAHAAICAAWALSNLLFSCPPEVALVSCYVLSACLQPCQISDSTQALVLACTMDRAFACTYWGVQI